LKVQWRAHFKAPLALGMIVDAKKLKSQVLNNRNQFPGVKMCRVNHSESSDPVIRA